MSIFCKVGNGLLPVDDAAHEQFASLNNDDEIFVKFDLGRNVKNHKRFFSFLKITFDWQTEFQNKEIWLYQLKKMAGHCYQIVAENGAVDYVPKSISFENIDDDEFKRFFSAAINSYLASKYARELSNEQLSVIVNY